MCARTLGPRRGCACISAAPRGPAQKTPALRYAHTWSGGEGRGRAARGQRPGKSGLWGRQRLRGRRGSLRDMEAREEAQAADTSLPEREATALEPEPPSPSSPDATPPPPPLPPAPTSPGGSEETEGPEPETRLEEEEASSPWSGPDELKLLLQDGQRCVRARCSLAEGLSWGPFRGSIQTRTSSPGQAEPSPALTLLLEDEACWLRTLPRALTEAEANSEIYRKDGALWCRLTRPVAAGGRLSVLLAAEPHSAPSQPVKEPVEPEGLAPSPATDIQLLPQQAGMASILATAVVNKDVFPCKDCGIWYRSERNLQAHLLYYCASRQGTSSPAVAAPEEKPKETYPNERVCPFPQCRKSCPSASSLEIHMRSHSGERPFVCLICLSAFTTKANCERHLKVHTDTLTGVCHSCGFISTTRDILYSHLVTNHMVCQPGSKVEIYSSGAGHPTAKLPAASGLAQAGPAPGLKCGPWRLPADSLAAFQQHTALHGPLAPADLGLVPAPSPGLDRKALAETTNGETRPGPQNGGGGEPPATPRSIKVEAAEEPEAEPGPPALSRTPSPPSAGPSPVRVKAELSSPTPGSSPGPGALFLPQLPTAPPASEILAKMSELVHSRLQAGAGVGAPAGLFTGGPKGATCFDCDITFNNVNNFYVHKRLYCSGRRPPDDTFSSLSTFIAHKKYYCSSHAAEHVKSTAALQDPARSSGLATRHQREALNPGQGTALPPAQSQATQESREGSMVGRMKGLQLPRLMREKGECGHQPSAPGAGDGSTLTSHLSVTAAVTAEPASARPGPQVHKFASLLSQAGSKPRRISLPPGTAAPDGLHCPPPTRLSTARTQKEGWKAEAGTRCKGNRENVEEGGVQPEDLHSLEPRGLHRRHNRDDRRAREEPRGQGPGCGGAREKAAGPGRVPAGIRRVIQLPVQQPWRYSLYPPPPSPSSQEDVGSGRGRDRTSIKPVLGAPPLNAHTAAVATSLLRLRPSLARRPALACLSRVAAPSS
ncbi:zinc finger protein ZFPM1 [Neophocaena asiaeorientalis asiaeorientalis]|uniref:Zinc finger protein ZFPM1 n=1 Tax=Neophocaena asiaeorientalis asiaeorientalis TaxID=1706337 RepID=A0A341ALL8_NEOAA|nr:zinc finger protein ZFPM1 [Neophocaena asiaeorientalis asiaeorientalis]